MHRADVMRAVRGVRGRSPGGAPPPGARRARRTPRASLGDRAARAEKHATVVELAFMSPFVLGGLLHYAFWRAVTRRNHLSRELGAVQLELASVAHDLRGPLMTTRSYLELLNAGGLGPLTIEAREVASRAAVATAQAQSLTASLRRLGGSEQGGAAVATAFAPVDMEALLSEVVTSLDAQIQLADAIVTFGPLPPAIGDRQALFRVFANLVENAVKYRAAGRAAQVRIAGTREGDRVCYAVRDWGIGIPEGERERVFALRARGSRAGPRDGTGLGLTTVRRLCELQGGSARIDPTVSEGTCVQVTLPAAEPVGATARG